MTIRNSVSILVTGLLTFVVVDRSRGDESVATDLAAIVAVRPDGVGHAEAQAAAARLSQLESGTVTEVLTAFDGASPLVKNWLRVITASIADNGDFPTESLQTFLADRDGDADARYLAFQLLTANDPESLPRLIEGAETDPSLPLRFLAISRILDRAEREIADGDREAAVATLKKVLAEGRSPEQLKSAAKSLEGLDQPVDLAAELALVRDWWILGTYDNTDSQHFGTVYLPESTYLETNRLPADWLAPGAAIRRGDVSDQVPAGQVARRVTSDDSLGLVDINPPFENAKDAIVYGYIEFTLDPERFADGSDRIAAEARLGCITANKVWVNGKMVTANEVYHSGTRIDQYIGECQLQPGLNTVLVKVCQNAQTESWAQDWRFQFRFTEPSGAALPIETTTPAE